MSTNEVLDSTEELVRDSKYLKINSYAIGIIAEELAKQKFRLPDWKMEVFPEKSTTAINFFFLGNSINFAFMDFNSKIKYEKDFNGKKWSGATGMWASLKNALNEGIPILNADYLANIKEDNMRSIFAGKIEIPLLTERTKIFNEVGRVLAGKYNGDFYNLIQASNNKLFDNGNGIVERLVRDFPSFDDSCFYNGKKIKFYKRAQLAPAMIYGRCKNEGVDLFEDIGELTAFADYQLPKSLRSMLILSYGEELAKKVDNQELIEKDSLMELELRAATVHASKKLLDKINEQRNEISNPINICHLDYMLWLEGRKLKTNHHLTITTNY
jgi:hypothetical protein